MAAPGPAIILELQRKDRRKGKVIQRAGNILQLSLGECSKNCHKHLIGQKELKQTHPDARKVGKCGFSSGQCVSLKFVLLQQKERMDIR